MGIDWNDEQEQFVQDNYGIISAARIAQAMPGDRTFTRSAVVGKAKRMGLKSELDNTGKSNSGIRRGKHPGTNRPRMAASLSQHKTRTVITRTNQAEGGYYKQVTQAETVSIDLADIVSKPTALLELEPHQCRWPLDDGMFCGSRKAEPVQRAGRLIQPSYCPGHDRASINPTTYQRGLWR